MGIECRIVSFSLVFGSVVNECFADMICATLEGHNVHRRNANMQELQWDESVAKSAQKWADHLKEKEGCEMVHSQTEGLGENLFWAKGYGDISDEEKATDSCKSWYGELTKYQFPGGDKAYDACGGSYEDYGHLTQVGCF